MDEPDPFICLRGPGRLHLQLGPRPLGSQSVSVSSRLLTQMERVCSSMADIASWVDQVLATWAGTASGMEQGVLEFLSALAKANKDILRPTEELRCRLLMLRRQAVVESLPRTFSDRDRMQLLSSPFSDMLFDPTVVASVQDKEHLASQQRMLSSVVQGLASSFRGSSSASRRGTVRQQTRSGSAVRASSSTSVPRTSSVAVSFRARSSRNSGFRGRGGSR